MAKKITYAELVAKVQSRGLTDKQAAKYFKPTVNRSGSGPGARVNEKVVDITGAERQAATAFSLTKDAASRKVAKAAAAPNRSIVAEGDSWFNLPDIPVIVPRTLADFLSDEFPINNIAWPGDRLIEEMFRSRQYVAYLDPKKLKFFLLSGGGVDIFTVIKLIVNQRRSADNDPANARGYLNAAYTRLMRDLRNCYDQIVADVAAKAPNARMIVHGYDYPNPLPDGPYLGSRLQFRGFHPVDNKAITTRLLKHVVDDFNEMLADLSGASGGRVTYVNLRNQVRKLGSFWDEIHPKQQAAKRIAANFFEPILAS